MATETKSMKEQWEAVYNSASQKLKQGRQDSDMTIYNLAEFKLKNSDNDEMANVYNYTSNRPKVYADRIMEGIANSDPQIIVRQGGKSNAECTKLEDNAKLLLASVDELFGLRKMQSLLAILSGQITLRGSIAGVVWPFDYEGSGQLVPAITPWDTRYSAYKVGTLGLKLAGTRLTKDADAILEDHQYETEDETMEVTDLWSATKNEVIAAGVETPIKSLPFDLDFAPVFFHECGVNAWHRDPQYHKYIGESCYTHIRGLIDTYNRLISVLNTLTMRAFSNGLQFINEMGPAAKLPDDVTADMVVNKIGVNAKFESMPLNDIQQATLMLKQIIDQEYLYGTLPYMEYGDLDERETVAQITTKATKTASVFRPRKFAIEKALEDIIIMMISLIDLRALPTEMKLRGKVVKLEGLPSDLSEFTIKVNLNIQSPQMDIANASLAQALSMFLDLETILEKFIQVDDTTGVITAREKEAVDRALPKIVATREMLRRSQSKDEVVRAEAQMISEFLNMEGNQPPPTEQETLPPGAGEEQAKPFVPLTA